MNKNANSIREDLKRDGYSKEEEYFYHLNQELIEKKKKDLEEKNFLKNEKQKEKKDQKAKP